MPTAKTAAASRLLVPLAALALVITGVALFARRDGAPNGDRSAPSDAGRSGATASRSDQNPRPGEEGGQSLDGQQLAVAAADHLSQGPSISARMHQRIKLLEGDVLGVGSYRQEAFQEGGRFHLQLRTKTGALLIVSDGNYLWHQLSVGETRRITRTDLLYDRLAGSDAADTTPRDLSSPFRPRSISPLEVGGIGRLLSILARTYRFAEPERKVLSDVPIYELKGILEPQKSDRPHDPVSSGRPPARTAARKGPPPQVPSHVTLSLGEDDLFPYRIVFDTRNAVPGDHERGVPRRVEIQFSEVSLGGTIDNRWFEYSPPRDVAWEDLPLEMPNDQ